MINEKFYELPIEKQQKIINAGLEVFGTHEYKRAVTDEIAHKANISKGLLFHYFKNKKTFYLFLYHYCGEMMKSLLLDESYKEINDFFELLEFGSKRKIEILTKHPYIMNFVMKVFYTHGEEVSDDVNAMLHKQMENNFNEYFSCVDFSKFKDSIKPKKVYQILVWMTEGYLLEKQRIKAQIDVNEVLSEFNEIMNLMKTMSYKEECL